MKGTATMPMVGLSAGTRQCACGGWTRFIVCQYCGTTDPAFAAAGMVSITPLAVPARDADPQAIPPQAPPPGASVGTTSPLPVATQVPAVDAGDYAGLEAAAARMVEHATPSAFAVPAAAPAVVPASAPLAPPTAPFSAPPAAPTTQPFEPAATLPAPPVPATLPAPPAAFGAPSAPAAPTSWTPEPPAPVAPPVPAHEPPADEPADTAAPDAAGRPKWLLPVVAAAVVVVAGGAYFAFGRGGSSDSGSTGLVPKGHPVAVAPAAAATGGAALMSSHLPPGAQGKSAAPVIRPVASLQPATLTGRAATGATAASAYVISVGGTLEKGTALTFATPADATAFAAGPAVEASGWKIATSKDGVTTWKHTGDTARAVTVASGTTAFVLTGDGDPAVTTLRAWAAAILVP